MDAIQTLSLALGASWAAGLNLYAAILVIGLMGSYGAIDLPSHLEVVENPWVLAAAGFMYCVEFFADKVPGVDSLWDSVHTFIRIPAGAILAAQALGPVDPAWQVAAGLVGGSLAAGTHAAKSGTRLLLNTSPEPVTNIGASILEDIMVVAGVWTALQHPWIFLALLAAFIMVMIWALPRMWRAIRSVFRWMTSVFRTKEMQKTPASSAD